MTQAQDTELDTVACTMVRQYPFQALDLNCKDETRRDHKKDKKEIAVLTISALYCWTGQGEREYLRSSEM